MSTRVLALEPYYGGSHRAFLDGWSKQSQLDWTILGLPSHHWKWRMRHAPLTMAEQVRQRVLRGERWDILLCSDMLNLAEFRGLAPASVVPLPAVVYFHENQLTYPTRVHDPRDQHFSFSNLMAAMAADEVWFNSKFHHDEFFAELRCFLNRMPDYQPIACVDRIVQRCKIYSPGIDPFPSRSPRRAGPLAVLWAARWEHDKGPDTFFDALERLAQLGVSFRISVIGQSFRQSPDIFETGRKRWADRIDRWGFQPTREAYTTSLLEADVFVSTAEHEFFGIAAVEAMLAGAYPLLPRRLSYPELLKLADISEMSQFFYDGSAGELADRLRDLSELLHDRSQWQQRIELVRNSVTRFAWKHVAPQMDEGLERLVR